MEKPAQASAVRSRASHPSLSLPSPQLATVLLSPFLSLNTRQDQDITEEESLAEALRAANVDEDTASRCGDGMSKGERQREGNQGEQKHGIGRLDASTLKGQAQKNGSASALSSTFCLSIRPPGEGVWCLSLF